MWPLKWLLFTVIVCITLRQVKADDSYYDDDDTSGQIVFNFYLNGKKKPYYNRHQKGRNLKYDKSNLDYSDDKEISKISSELNSIIQKTFKNEENSTEIKNRFDIKSVLMKYGKKFLKEIPEITCASCELMFDMALLARKTSKEVAQEFCSVIYTSKVCKGIIDLHYDIMIYIVDSRPDLTGKDVCNLLAQPMGCFVPRNSAKFNSWEINIPPPSNEYRPKTIRQSNQNDLKILQITDIHYDPKYKQGHEAKCRQTICCRNERIPFFGKKAAGKWGNYEKCDMPIESVINLMEQTSKHDVEYVYFTGDIIAHNVWETSIESNSQSLFRIYSLFFETFIKRGIIVYPILGNHEFHPLDMNPPKNVPNKFSQQWLFDLVAEIWGHWLPADTLDTIKQGGFYTVVPKPGFRIIALNSNMAFIYNLWLLYDDVDPYGQLQWLADTLALAERNNENVHILSHVPPGEKDTYAKWSYEYSRIIRRFAHIITGQFCGHTHNVQMYYFYQPDDQYPVNIMYNGGSFSTFTDNNPNYRIYHVNPETMAVENFYDWSFNLTEANEFGEPNWTYTDFKQEFGLKSMSREHMGELIYKMVENEAYLDKYFELKVRRGDTSMKKGCDRDCKLDNLCQILKTEPDSDYHCKYFVNMFKQYHG